MSGILAYFILPFFLTLGSFWVFFTSKELKERGAKLSPFLWAFAVWGLCIIFFPLFLLLRYTKWNKEAVGPKPSQGLNQGKRILVIFAFFAVYLLTLYVLSNVDMPTFNSAQENKTTEPISTTTQDLTSTQDETADWQTYRNEEYGFEFQYPEDYFKVIKTNTGIGDYIGPGESYVFFETSNYEEGKYIPAMSVIFSQYDIDKYREVLDGRGQEITDLEEVMIGNQKSYTFRTGSLQMGDYCEAQTTIIPDIKKEGYLYFFIIHCNEFQGNDVSQEYLSKDDIEIFNEIISTFKFIKANETADWQTYNTGQEVMGLSLNNPAGWTVNFREESHFYDALSRISFDFAPSNWNTSYGVNWMGWGTLKIGVYSPEININRWVDRYLSNYKDSLAITEEGWIGEKLVFALNQGEGWDDEKLGAVWVPQYVILGTQYSYSYGFSQDGANNFVQIIQEEIFPNISIE